MNNELNNNFLYDQGPMVVRTCNEVSSRLLNKFAVENNNIIEATNKNIIINNDVITSPNNVEILTDNVIGGSYSISYSFNVNLFGFEISIWYIILIIIIILCIVYLIYK